MPLQASLATYFTPSNFCRFLPFSRHLFHDSNSADPATPPPELKPSNGDGSGQGTEPPEPTVPTPKVTQINVIAQPTKSSPLKASDAWSFEGKRPNLAGIEIELWYDDHTLEVVKGDDAYGKGIVTIPKILGQAYISNNVSPGVANTLATTTMIQITHVLAESVLVTAPVELPGVRAIDTTYKLDGFTAGLKVGGGKPDFWEDGGEPDLSVVTVTAWYQGLSSTVNNASGEQLNLVSPGSSGITLGPDYVFTDYWNGFPGKAYQGDPDKADFTKRYAYGVDPQDKSVYILLSRAATEAKHTGANSPSQFIKVGLGNYYYINHVEPVLPVAWKNGSIGAYWYSDDTKYRGNAGTGWADNHKAWEDILVASNLKLTVFYMNADDSSGSIANRKDREVGHLVRAIQLGNARVEKVPDFRLFEDGPENVTVFLGYYGYDNLQGNNTPGKEGFPNIVELQVPIATFLERVEFIREKNSVNDKPLEYKALTTNVIPADLFKSIKDTYDLVGYYSFGSGPDVTRAVPDEIWNASWFAPGDLRGFDGTVKTEITMEVTIRATAELVADGTFGSYVGLDTTIPIMALPAY